VTIRNSLKVLFATLTALVAIMGTSSVVSADPGGSGHVYRCSAVRMTDDSYIIAFSKIYTCSNGPMDNSLIQELSTYTDKQTGSITGECAWHAYHRLGWRDMKKVWNWCLTNPRFVS
jgi:hypothetical protein